MYNFTVIMSLRQAQEAKNKKRHRQAHRAGLVVRGSEVARNHPGPSGAGSRQPEPSEAVRSRPEPSGPGIRQPEPSGAVRSRRNRPEPSGAVISRRSRLNLRNPPKAASPIATTIVCIIIIIIITSMMIIINIIIVTIVIVKDGSGALDLGVPGEEVRAMMRGSIK
uniref:Uncharacterized protein n=1 Tax=Anopheles atroparvus TaxID=41427 RepID=A0A182JKB3_ANOAO